MKRVCVIGLGYIGLPTAALLANRGYEVLGVDIVPETVETINRGEIHIVEPDLDTFVKAAVNSGRLRASLDPDSADVFILAVPTPFGEGHVPNIDYVVSAARSIAPSLRAGNLVILESTSPVGTTEKIREVLLEEGVATEGIRIAHCPERVLPGQIMRELVENDRIVGGLDKEATAAAADFYRGFVQGEVLETDARTAEMAKLTENSFRDINIAFANELSILCDRFGIDVWELIALANRHPRVNILKPGPGVGGHCIAVDPWFIVHAGGEDARLIRTGREVNTHKTEWVISRIRRKLSELRDTLGHPPLVACMGLAFKPDIDDLRESPALYITRRLIAEGERVVAVEPNVDRVEGVELIPMEKAEEADLIVFLVAHREFGKFQPKTNTMDFCGVTAGKGKHVQR